VGAEQAAGVGRDGEPAAVDPHRRPVRRNVAEVQFAQLRGDHLGSQCQDHGGRHVRRAQFPQPLGRRLVQPRAKVGWADLFARLQLHAEQEAVSEECRLRST
jgi:hypothetical protein